MRGATIGPVRIVIQRVSSASVTVAEDLVANIGVGLCLLVGVAATDEVGDVEAAVAKISGLRIFNDEHGKMNRSVADVGGQILLVSQFTLYGDMRRGRRPSFTGAAASEVAKPLISQMVAMFRAEGLETREGVFGAAMSVKLINEGPVTLVLDVRGGSIE